MKSTGYTTLKADPIWGPLKGIIPIFEYNTQLMIDYRAFTHLKACNYDFLNVNADN